jgi:hypothetical protein
LQLISKRITLIFLLSIGYKSYSSGKRESKTGNQKPKEPMLDCESVVAVQLEERVKEVDDHELEDYDER